MKLNSLFNDEEVQVIKKEIPSFSTSKDYSEEERDKIWDDFVMAYLGEAFDDDGNFIEDKKIYEDIVYKMKEL